MQIKKLQKLNINKVDGVLYDLGVSSFQFDIKERGFSYNMEGDLDMRMNTNDKLTAKDVVNQYTKEELIRIFRDYGEENFARQGLFERVGD